MELYLPPIKKQKRPFRIVWSDEMIKSLQVKFPFTFNRELAKELKVSMRSLIRKARELGLEKEPGFLSKNRALITQMAVANNHNKYTGQKGWSVPNSEATRFKKGNVPAICKNQSVLNRIHLKRNETIRRERIRIRYGMTRLTKLNLKE